VSAATLTVCPSGCTFSTIQAAIDAAGSGDRIRIAAGSYSENLNTGAKDLSLTGAGAGKTTIDGDGSGTVVTIGSGSVEISGVTITGGSGQFGGGIRNISGTMTLKNSRVTGNTADLNGGGIANPGGGTVTIKAARSPATRRAAPAASTPSAWRRSATAPSNATAPTTLSAPSRRRAPRSARRLPADGSPSHRVVILD
jgi:nitrous oxidase accessory protein NosD